MGKHHKDQKKRAKLNKNKSKLIEGNTTYNLDPSIKHARGLGILGGILATIKVFLRGHR